MGKVVAALLAFTALAGCATDSTPRLAPLPADLTLCFNRFVPMPVKGPISRQQIFKLVSDLKRSELEKSQCGKRLIAWYETQRG